MKVQVKCKGYLLDESKGDFVANDGRIVEYHKARFYDTVSGTLFKVSVPEGRHLPESQQVVTILLEIIVAERFCKCEYCGFEQ